MSGISIDEFKKAFDDMNFLDRLADQAYPIVNHKLVRLLSEMGFSVDFPLSLPEVENRVKPNQILEIDEQSVKIAPAVKSKTARKSLPNFQLCCLVTRKPDSILHREEGAVAFSDRHLVALHSNAMSPFSTPATKKILLIAYETWCPLK